MGKPSYEALAQRVRELDEEVARLRRLAGQRNQEENTARKYLDIAGVIIVALNSEGLVTLINRKGCELLGYPEEEVVGKAWFDTFLPETISKEVRAVFQRLMRGEMAPAEYYRNPVLARNGGERIIAWHNTLLTDRSGRIAGTLSSGEDITERVRAEEALRKAHDELSLFSKELETMVQTRTEELNEKNRQLFEAERLAALGKVANRVAHELRNPLMVIGGFARRMDEKTPEADPNKKYLRIILGEVQVLENRISEIARIGTEEAWLGSPGTEKEGVEKSDLSP